MSTFSFSYGVTGIQAKPTAATAAGTASAHQRGHVRDPIAAASATITIGAT